MKLEDADEVPQPAPMTLPLTIWYAGIYILAFAGWWKGRSGARGNALWWTGTMLVVVISFFSAVYFGGPRMRAPVMPWFCLLSSGTLALLAAQVRVVRRGNAGMAGQVLRPMSSHG